MARSSGAHWIGWLALLAGALAVGILLGQAGGAVASAAMPGRDTAFPAGPGAVGADPPAPGKPAHANDLSAAEPSLQLKNSGTGDALSLQVDAGAFIRAAAAGGSPERFRLDSGGAVWTAAESQVSISPLNAFSDAAVIVARHSAGYIEVSSGELNEHYLYMPVDVPTRILGSAQKLKSLRVCYSLDNSTSGIFASAVQVTGDTGLAVDILYDETPRTLPSDWTCYTVNPAVPAPLDGSLAVRLKLQYQSLLHRIRIGNISLTLVE